MFKNIIYLETYSYWLYKALYLGNPAGNLWADTIFLFWGLLALCFDDLGNFPLSLFIAGVVTVSLDFVLCILNVIHRKQ